MDGLRHPFLGVVIMGPHAVIGLIAGRIIGHRVTVLRRDPVCRRVYREGIVCHPGLTG